MRPPTPGEGWLSLTLAKNEIKIDGIRQNAHGGREKKNMQLSVCEQTCVAATRANVATFASDGDCVAPTTADSANICGSGAVAYALDMRVTAQVSLTHVGRLQPWVSRLQRRHRRFVSVQTPRSTDFAPDKS